MTKSESVKNQIMDLETQVKRLRDRLESLNIRYFRTLEHWDAKHTLLASRVREAINTPYKKNKGQKRIEQLNIQKQEFSKLIIEVEDMFNIRTEEHIEL